MTLIEVELELLGYVIWNINKGTLYTEGSGVYLVQLVAQTKPVGAVMIVLYGRSDDISDVYKFTLVELKLIQITCRMKTTFCEDCAAIYTWLLGIWECSNIAGIVC